MQNSISRRAALAAIGSAGAVATVPVAAVAASAVDRTAWDEAMQAYEAAKAEDEAFNAVFDRLYNRCRAAEEAIPHTTLQPDPYSGRVVPVTTTDRDFVIEARRLVDKVAAGKCYLETERYPSLGKHYQLCQDVKAAADKRDRQVRIVRAHFGMDEAEEKWEALGQRAYEAEWALMNTPAPDALALLWKLEKLLAADPNGSTDSWAEHAVKQTMSDARRLLSTGRA